MAAGAGFKTFNTGDVLSAADVNTYLMQGVWVFASAAARDAAVTSPQEGNFAYLKDTNVTTYYTGSAWANLDTTGMTNPMTTTGDTIYSSSGSTPARLGIGTAGQVLTVNSGATAPEWKTPAASGGGMTLLSTTTLSGASTTISSISGSYTDLSIRLIDATTSVDSTEIYCRINGDTSTSNYVSLAIYTYDALSEPYAITNQSYIRFQNGTTSTTQKNKANSVLNMLDYTSTGTKFMNFSSGVIKTSGEKNMQSGIGVYVGSSAISSLTFFPYSGTLSGTVNIYGVK